MWSNLHRDASKISATYTFEVSMLHFNVENVIRTTKDQAIPFNERLNVWLVNKE